MFKKESVLFITPFLTALTATQHISWSEVESQVLGSTRYSNQGRRDLSFARSTY